MPNHLAEYLKGRKPNGFTPRPFICEEGDFLTYYFRDEECYEYREDDILTLYLSQNDHSLVGFKLKGLRRIFESLEGVLGTSPACLHNLKLSSLPLAMLSEAISLRSLGVYQQLIRKTQDVRVKPEGCEMTQ